MAVKLSSRLRKHKCHFTSFCKSLIFQGESPHTSHRVVFQVHRKLTPHTSISHITLSAVQVVQEIVSLTNFSNISRLQAHEICRHLVVLQHGTCAQRLSNASHTSSSHLVWQHGDCDSESSSGRVGVRRYGGPGRGSWRSGTGRREAGIGFLASASQGCGVVMSIVVVVGLFVLLLSFWAHGYGGFQERPDSRPPTLVLRTVILTQAT